jgi:hypothetical protein
MRQLGPQAPPAGGSENATANNPNSATHGSASQARPQNTSMSQLLKAFGPEAAKIIEDYGPAALEFLAAIADFVATTVTPSNPSGETEGGLWSAAGGADIAKILASLIRAVGGAGGMAKAVASGSIVDLTGTGLNTAAGVLQAVAAAPSLSNKAAPPASLSASAAWGGSAAITIWKAFYNLYNQANGAGSTGVNLARGGSGLLNFVAAVLAVASTELSGTSSGVAAGLASSGAWTVGAFLEGFASYLANRYSSRPGDIENQTDTPPGGPNPSVASHSGAPVSAPGNLEEGQSEPTMPGGLGSVA